MLSWNKHKPNQVSLWSDTDWQKLHRRKCQNFTMRWVSQAAMHILIIWENPYSNLIHTELSMVCVIVHSKLMKIPFLFILALMHGSNQKSMMLELWIPQAITVVGRRWREKSNHLLRPQRKNTDWLQRRRIWSMALHLKKGLMNSIRRCCKGFHLSGCSKSGSEGNEGTKRTDKTVTTRHRCQMGHASW